MKTEIGNRSIFFNTALWCLRMFLEDCGNESLLEKLRTLTCLSEAFITEVMGIMRMSR